MSVTLKWRFNYCMAKHTLIKLLMDMDSARLGLLWFSLVYFGLDFVFWLLCICYLTLCPYASLFNSCSSHSTHKACVSQWANIKQYGCCCSLRMIATSIFQAQQFSGRRIRIRPRAAQKYAFVKMKRNKIY